MCFMMKHCFDLFVLLIVASLGFINIFVIEDIILLLAEITVKDNYSYNSIVNRIVNRKYQI